LHHHLQWPWRGRQGANRNKGALDGSPILHATTGPSWVLVVATNLLAPTSPPVDLKALAAVQASCSDCQHAQMLASLQVSLIRMPDTPILVNTFSGVFRLVIPATFWQPIFDTIRGLAQPGVRASSRPLNSRFVWRCLASQVAAWCCDCQQRQRAKVLRSWWHHCSPSPIHYSGTATFISTWWGCFLLTAATLISSPSWTTRLDRWRWSLFVQLRCTAAMPHWSTAGWLGSGFHNR
jgi:hypothetical protein